MVKNVIGNNFIPLPKPKGDNDLLVKVTRLEKENETIKLIMIGVIIVFFVSFLGFVIDSFMYRTDAYNSFKEIIKKENVFIEDEIKQRNDYREDIKTIKKVLKL